MKTCFLVCQIGPDNSDIRKKSDKVFKYLVEPVCKELDFSVIRVDKINATDQINETIIRKLKDSDLVIIDMSEHNPNVFYEFGYRHAINKPLIPITTKSNERIPFDVSTLRTIFYTTEVDDIEDAKSKLRETIRSIDFNKQENSQGKETLNNKLNTSLLNLHDKVDTLIEQVSSTKHKNVNREYTTPVDISDDDLPF